MTKLFRTQDAVSPVLYELIEENETTLSFFNHAAYEEFKKNPEEKWM
jgi:hypothetical protein